MLPVFGVLPSSSIIDRDSANLMINARVEDINMVIIEARESTFPSACEQILPEGAW